MLLCFCCCDYALTNINLGKERLSLAYPSPSQSIRKGSQGQEPRGRN